jgi:hypothetical protein
MDALKIYTLQHFYIYIGTYVGVCAPFVFPMKNSVFSTCFSFAVVALPPLTTTNTRLHHKRSTLRLHPNQDAQLLPLSYRPGTLIHPSTKTPLPSLILQSTCLLLFCAIINTLFLIPYFDFVLVAERLHDLQFISFTPSYYQQPVAYPTRASGPFTPLTSRFTSRDTEGSKTPSRRHFLYIVASVALDAERVPSWHTATHSHTPAAGRRTNNHTTTAMTTTASSRDYLHIHHSQANP